MIPESWTSAEVSPSSELRRDRLGDAALQSCLPAGALDGKPGDRLTGPIAREQPLLGAGGLPVVAENVQQLGREHHVAILPPFALFDADHHALAVNRDGLEAHYLGHRQPSRVTDGQDDTMLQARHSVEELADLLPAEHVRKLVRLPAGRDVRIDQPVTLEGDGVEKPQGSHRGRDRTGSKVFVLCEMHPIGSDLFVPQALGRSAKMTGELGNLLQIGGLGQRREVANLHVLDHATAKRGHWQLLCEMKGATASSRSQVVRRGEVGAQPPPTEPARGASCRRNQRNTAKRFSPKYVIKNKSRRGEPGPLGQRQRMRGRRHSAAGPVATRSPEPMGPPIRIPAGLQFNSELRECRRVQEPGRKYPARAAYASFAAVPRQVGGPIGTHPRRPSVRRCSASSRYLGPNTKPLKRS